MYGYIYKTVNLINETIYVGQSVGIFRPTYLGSGNLIIKAIKKYGRDNFRVEVLELCESREHQDVCEKKHIKFYRDNGTKMYNIANGGFGHSGPFTDEHLSNLRKIRKTTEYRERLSKALKGQKRTQKQIERNRISHLGIIPGEETRAKMRLSQAINNYIRTPESNLLRSQKLMGRVITPEWKAKIASTKAKTRLKRLAMETIKNNVNN